VGFHIDPTSGTLTPVPGSPFATQGMRFVNAMTTDGLGHLLYVTEGVGGSNMNAYFINSSNGALTPVAGNPASLPVSFLKSEPSGRFLVGINDKTGTSGVPSDTNVYVFSIDQSTGLITQVPLSPFTTPLPPIQLFVHPNGRFIYTANDNLGGGLGPVQGFTLDSTGNVTPMSGSPFSNLASVAECDGDHTTGAELMCTDGSTFFAFDIDSNTGNLSRVAAPFVSGQNQPFAVTAPQ
jgi:6-phosphogluconolactonase (cycloisomerase 2 family)